MLLPSPARSASRTRRKRRLKLGAKLGYYHERRDENRNIGLRPEHLWASHAADAFGCLDGICTCGPRNGYGGGSSTTSRTPRSRIRFTIRRCRQSWFKDIVCSAEGPNCAGSSPRNAKTMAAKAFISGRPQVICIERN